MSKYRIRFGSFVLCWLFAFATVLWGGERAGEKVSSADVWNIPSNETELQKACRDIPELSNISGGTESLNTIECSVQAIVLGNRIPVAPAPHIPWAKPYGKKLRILIFAPIGHPGPEQGRELAQLTRELDCDPRWVLFAWPLFGNNPDEGYKHFLAKQALESLKEDYDVIILSLGSYPMVSNHGILKEPDFFPKDVCETILAKVKNGCGLVLVGSHYNGLWWEKTPLAEAAPARKISGTHARVNFSAAGDSPMFRGVPLASISTSSFYRWQVKEGATITAMDGKEPLVMESRYGKGRVVLLGWAGTLAPICHQNYLDLDRAISIPLRAVVTAAGVPPPVTVDPQKTVLPAGKPGKVIIKLDGAARLECALRDDQELACGNSRDSRNESIYETTLDAKPGEVAVNLPALPKGGHYWLDVIARDSKGVSLGWGCTPIEVTDERKLEVKTDKEIYKIGETAHARISVQGQVASPTARFEVRDVSGRLLAQGSLKPDSTGAFTFDYPIKDSRVAPHEVIATLADNGQAILREKAMFFVPDFTWNDYENVHWGYIPDPRSRDETDITAPSASWDAEEDSLAAARLGLRPWFLNRACIDVKAVTKTPDEEESKWNESANQMSKADVKKSIEVARRYGSAAAWMLQDEYGSHADVGMPNEEGLRRYHEYLKAQYGAIEKLNASWGTEHKSWDEIKPMLVSDLNGMNAEALRVWREGIKAKYGTLEKLNQDPKMCIGWLRYNSWDDVVPRMGETGIGMVTNFAPWIDFRLYVSDQVYQAWKRRTDLIRGELGPMPLGLDGATLHDGYMSIYGGINLGRMFDDKVFTGYIHGGDDLMMDSMVPGPSLFYQKWGGNSVPFGSWELIWLSAFRGFGGTFRYSTSIYFSPFGWVNPSGRRIAESSKELRHGVGKLLMGAKRQTDVAFLYSYPSLLATIPEALWIEGTDNNQNLMWKPDGFSLDAMEKMVVQCGNMVAGVTEEQVVAGALRDRKLLIIPHIFGSALRDDTCAAIVKFVENGGLVVADMAPAVLDGHGAPRSKGGLNDLFGVTRDRIFYRQRAADQLVYPTEVEVPPLAPQSWYIGEWCEAGLKVTDGKALGKHWFQEVPAFVTKRTGKGRALLLNFLFTSTFTARPSDSYPYANETELMRSILKAAGIQPQAVIEDDNNQIMRHCEVNTLRDGAAEYVGVYAVMAPDSPPSKMTIRFPAARETYDVRAGKYLGMTNSAPLPLFRTESVLFARLDYKITGMDLKVDGKAQRGQPISYDIVVRGTKPVGRHIVHLEVTDPNGDRNAYYCRNVEVVAGHSTGQIHTALNDVPGKWTVVAREVVSGQTIKKTFALK